MDLSKMIKWLGWNELPPEFLSSLCVCLIIIVLSIVLYFKIKAYDPLKKPTGIVHAWEILVSFAGSADKWWWRGYRRSRR